MPRRPMLLALLMILGATPHALAADGSPAGGVPAAAASPAACRGVALERFEQGLPADTRRYAVGAHLASPFAELWNKARRPDLTAVPDAVTIYARGSQPLLIAYRTGHCVLAVVTLPRDRLWRVLREELGQSV